MNPLIPPAMSYIVAQLFFYKDDFDIRYMYSPISQAGCDTKSIFKWSLTDLNSVFFLLDQLPYQG